MDTIAIAADHAGFAVKEAIKKNFAEGITWMDLGTDSEQSVNYADFGLAMGKAISEGRVERGVLICGSGIGISIAANRYAKVRAALCTDVTMARLARSHNDANVIAFGSRITGIEVIFESLRVFLNASYEGGRHEARVGKLCTGI